MARDRVLEQRNLAALMLALRTGLPFIVTGLPSTVMPGRVALVFLVVVVVALFWAAVCSLSTIVTMSPTWRAIGFSNSATSRPV